MIYKTLSNCVNLDWPGKLHTLGTKLTKTARCGQTLKTVFQASKNISSAPRLVSINCDMFKHVSDVTLQSQTPLSSSHLFYSGTLLPLTYPISQHSWAVPHQSKGQFMGLMLQRVQTGLWDRMFGWYLALLKQTSHQNMITEGKEGAVFLSYFSSTRPY